MSTLEEKDIGKVEQYEHAGGAVGDHTPEEERKFVRKLDQRVLVWIMIMYMLSYLDRSNLGNSVALGLKKDLHLTSGEYQWAGALFYCATFAFGTVGGLMLKILRPRYFLAICMIGWGGMAAIQAAVHNFAGLGVARFFLGVFEAAFAPGCAFFLSFWYLKEELTLRIAAYAGTSAASGVIGGLISYGIGTNKHLKIEQWKVLFICEGVPTVLFGVLTMFMLPDRPETSKSSWFTAKEHAIALSRRTRYISNATDEGIHWGEVRAAFLDYRLWLFTAVYAGLSLSLAVISIFLPTLVATMGYAGYKSNLMTVPLYVVGYFGLLGCAWLSGRTKQRGIFIALSSFIGAAGYFIVGFCTAPGVRYFGAFLVVAGTYWSFPIVLAWISNTFASDSKGATGLGVVIAVTHAVGIAAANIYPTRHSPQYKQGCIISAALMILAGVGAILMRQLLAMENQRRDREYGVVVPGEKVTLEGNAADKTVTFRYIL